MLVVGKLIVYPVSKKIVTNRTKALLCYHASRIRLYGLLQLAKNMTQVELAGFDESWFAL